MSNEILKPAKQPKAEPTTEAVQLARKILRNLGFALEPSSEPGADERVDRIAALIAAPPAPAVPDAEALAQFIRVIDGNHNMGAAALSEAICTWLASASEPPA